MMDRLELQKYLEALQLDAFREIEKSGDKDYYRRYWQGRYDVLTFLLESLQEGIL